MRISEPHRPHLAKLKLQLPVPLLPRNKIHRDSNPETTMMMAMGMIKK